MSYLITDPAYRVTVSGDGRTVAVALPGATGPKGDPGSGGGGGFTPLRRTTGAVTFTPFAAGTSGAWTLYPGALWVTVPASAGDLLTYYPAIIANGADASGDLASVVAAAPKRYLSAGYGLTQNPLGHGGLYLSGNYGQAQYPALTWPVAADEIVAGNVTLALMYQAGVGRSVGSAAYPSSVDVVNLGPSA